MSVQQSPQQSPVRLLVADTNDDLGELINANLRNAGVATRLTVIDNLNAAQSAIAEATADLVVVHGGLDELGVLIGGSSSAGKRLPVVLATDQDSTISRADGIGAGATDVVPCHHVETIALVLRRELDNVTRNQHYDELKRSLKEAEQRCQLLLKGSSAAIAYVHEGMHIYANQPYLELFGFGSADDLLGAPLMDLVATDSAEQLKSALKEMRNNLPAVEFDFNGQSAEGDELAGHMHLERAEYDGEPCLQVTVTSEALAAPEPEEAPAPSSAPAAAGDALEPFTLAVDQALTAGDTLSGVFIAELDNCRDLEAEFGLLGARQVARDAMSLLLKALGEAPNAVLDAERLVFLACGEDHDAVWQHAEKLRSQLEANVFEASDRSARTTVSITGELKSELDASQTAVTMIDSALARLNQMSGSNQVVMPEVEEIEEPDDEASRMIRLINEAIENNTFVLVYQPILSLRGNDEEQYEAFLRMADADGELVGPDKFLNTALDHNVAGKIDRWVVLESIKMLSAHRAEGHDTRLTINLSRNSITDSDFIQWLGVAIKAARLPSDAVIFQITEEDARQYVRQTREFVEGLQKLHVRTGLSRFQTNDQAFDTLRHIPVEFVKLAGNDVASMETDELARERVTETLRRLQADGKLTIVPMVESATLLASLWQAGTNYIQGHYLQEPSTELNYDFTTEDC